MSSLISPSQLNCFLFVSADRFYLHSISTCGLTQSRFCHAGCVTSALLSTDESHVTSSVSQFPNVLPLFLHL